MDLKEYTNKICQQYNIRPSRTKGQNFLTNDDVYEEIIKASDLNKEDIVLEVGPGLGFLTEKLAARAKQVIAVELDDKLANILQNRLSKQTIENVEIINKNILDIDVRKLSFGYQKLSFGRVSCYKIAANLPYNITSIFLRKFLSGEHKPESMVLMLQREVAERICARPGKMSLLAVSVQFYCQPKIIDIVPKENFWPKPKIDSAIIKLDLQKETKFPTSNLVSAIEKEFFRLVKFGFSSKRKMLKNNLAGGYKISQAEAAEKIKLAGFRDKIRAQDLSVKDWLKLFGYLKQNML